MKKFILISSLLAAGTLGAWAEETTPAPGSAEAPLSGQITSLDFSSYGLDTVYINGITSVSGETSYFCDLEGNATAGYTDKVFTQNLVISSGGLTLTNGYSRGTKGYIFSGSISDGTTTDDNGDTVASVGNFTFNSSGIIQNYTFTGDLSNYSGNFSITAADGSTLTFSGTSTTALAGKGTISSSRKVVFSAAAENSAGEALSYTLANSSITALNLTFEGGATYVVSGKLEGANSTATNNTLTIAEGTTVKLEGSSALISKVSLAGAGTLDVGVLTGWISGSNITNWTGTVVIHGTYEVSGGYTVSSVCNANSKIQLAGFTGWFNTWNTDEASNFELVDTTDDSGNITGYAFNNKAVSSGDFTSTFSGKITGSGTFNDGLADSKTNANFKFTGDLSEFTGTFKSSRTVSQNYSNKLTFGAGTETGTLDLGFSIDWNSTVSGTGSNAVTFDYGEANINFTGSISAKNFVKNGSGTMTVGDFSTATLSVDGGAMVVNVAGTKANSSVASSTTSLTNGASLTVNYGLYDKISTGVQGIGLGTITMDSTSSLTVNSSNNRWGMDLSAHSLAGTLTLGRTEGATNTVEYTLSANQTLSGATLVIGEGAILQNYGTLTLTNMTISGDGTLNVRSSADSGSVGSVTITSTEGNMSQIYGNIEVASGTLYLSGTIDFNKAITVASSAAVEIANGTVIDLDGYEASDGENGARVYTLFKETSEGTSMGTVSVAADTVTGANGTISFMFEGGALSSRKSVDIAADYKTVTVSGTVGDLIWAGGATGTWKNEENLDKSARSTDWTWKSANDEYFANNDKVTFNTDGAQITVADGVEAKTLTVSDNVTLIFVNDGTTSETTTFKVNGTTDKDTDVFTGTTIAENKTLTLQTSLAANSYQKITLNATSSTGTIVVDHTSADYNLSLSVGENFAGTLEWQGNFNPNNLTDFTGSLTLKNSSTGSATSIWADAATSIGYNTTIDATNYSIALAAGTLTFEKDLTIAANSTVSVDSAISVAGTLYVEAGAKIGGSALTLTSAGINGFTTASGTGTIELTLATNSNSSKAVSFKSSPGFTGTVVLKGNTYSGEPASSILTSASSIWGDDINSTTFGSAAKLAFEGAVAIGNTNTSAIEAAIEIRKDASVYFYPNGSGTFTVNGTVDVQSGATVYTRNGTTSFKDMTLDGTLNAAGTTKLTGTVSGSGTLNITGGTTTITGSIGSDVTAKVTGGTANIQGNDAIDAIGTWTLTGGTMTIGANATNVTATASGAKITVGSGATLSLSMSQTAQSTFAGTITVQNGGTLAKYDGSQKLTNTVTLGENASDVVYVTGNWGKGGLDFAGTLLGAGTAYLFSGSNGSSETFTISGGASNYTGTLVVGKSNATTNSTLGVTLVASGDMSKATIDLAAGSNSSLQIDSALTAKAVTLSAGSQLLLTENLLAGTAAAYSTADETTLTIITSSAIFVAETALGTGDVSTTLADYVSLDSAFDAWEYQIWNYDGSALTLTLTNAIPEPSMFGLLAGTLALALAGTRRRRRGNAK